MLDFLLRLESAAAKPMYAQLAAQLREAIQVGRLAGGLKLPSTRALSDHLGVSRTTVTEAYGQLFADGYLEARGGSGTYVARLDQRSPAPARDRRPAAPARPALSAWAARLGDAAAAAAHRAAPAPEIDFRINTAAWDAFPYETWRRLAGRAWRGASTASMGYGDPAGWRPLREAIAAYLGRSRGVRCDADRVVIVNGSQQAVDLLARICLDPGDAVVMEEPGYPSARRTFAAYGARIVPVAVDGAGLRVEDLPSGADALGIKLVYTTPSHQFPTGATLSPGRRLALLTWASAHRAMILEDDYDTEFRYAGRPVESLQGLDRHGWAVYLGTFSKVLFPSLRLGYVVLPPALVGPFVAAKDLADRETAGPEQRVLAQFIADGHFERHIRRMRRLYAARHRALLGAIARHAGGLITPAPTTTGMSVLVTVNTPLTESEVVEWAAAAGIGLPPAGPCWHQRPPGPPAFTLGFAGLAEPQLDDGIRRLAAVLQAGRGSAGMPAMDLATVDGG